MKDFESLNGELTPHVREILDFLRRRNEGKHGRYLEGKRSELATALAEVAQSVASPPAEAPRRPPPTTAPPTPTPPPTATAPPIPTTSLRASDTPRDTPRASETP